MNIPVRDTVYELEEDITSKGTLYPTGSRFKIWTIRLTTHYDYVTFRFTAKENKHSPLPKELKGGQVTMSTKEFNSLKVRESV